MYFSVDNIHKTWDSTVVSFSMQAEKGSMTCLLGPSGSGKSTVLNIIAGLEANDRDFPLKIVLDGARIDGLPPARRGLGFVFQTGALFNHLDVADNVAYGLVSKGMKKKDARRAAGEYLDNFGLGGYDRREPQTLSGGERQRVALARTLITEPKLVLLDEPFSALDTDLRRSLALQLKAWQRQLGFTAIMVTHDEAEAAALGDVALRLSKS